MSRDFDPDPLSPWEQHAQKVAKHNQALELAVRHLNERYGFFGLMPLLPPTIFWELLQP